MDKLRKREESSTLRIATALIDMLILIPAKHRFDSLLKLNGIRFVDIASVNPEILQVITFSLFSTESDLVKTSLACFIPLYYIIKGNLLRSLYV